MKEIFQFVGSVKALESWFHSAHHLSSGSSFVGDHEILYNRLYDFFNKYFDKIVEKLIVLTGNEEIACPIVISNYSGNILSQIPTTANKKEYEISEISLSIIINHLHEIESIYDTFEKYEIMTKGMDDLLGSTYNELETFVYFLQRKLK